MIGLTLAALPAFSHAASEAASRLGLVPIAPGGSADDPPVYTAEEAAQISFGVYIDPELHGDPDEYLRQRAQLCLAGYGVVLFTRGEDQATIQLLEEGGGKARIDPAKLEPGITYGWQVVASLQDGSEVRSSPLYFRVGDVPQADGESETAAHMLALLARLSSDQQREANALDAYLSRTLVFETYPTASDSYICAPVFGSDDVPLPAQTRSALVPTQILPLLGTLMQQADVVQEALRTDEPAADKLDALLTQLGQLLSSVSYGHALSARAPTLAGILAKLQAAKASPEQTVALLSELRLALDSAIGFGSINLRQDYKDAFAAYASMAEERLGTISNYDVLSGVFGSDEAGKLLNMINDQRGALALLRDEVAKGRLSKTQLAQRLSAQRTRADEAAFYNYEIVDGASCALVGTPKDVDSARLQQEQFRCRLAHLLISVWTD